MGRATVLSCDVCHVWDSKAMPVRTTGVAGVKFDLCAHHRVSCLVLCGVTTERALRYISDVDANPPKRGRLQSLDSALTDHDLAPAGCDPADGAQVQAGPDEPATAGESGELRLIAELPDGVIAEWVADDPIPAAEEMADEIASTAPGEEVMEDTGTSVKRSRTRR